MKAPSKKRLAILLLLSAIILFCILCLYFLYRYKVSAVYAASKAEGRFLIGVIPWVLIIGVLIISFLYFYIRLQMKSNSLLEAERCKAKEAVDREKRASLAKREFLSRMSHEIRTPMNGIIGMTLIAMDNLENRDKANECLQKVLLSSKHLQALINDVLDMSKIENGKIDISHSKFDFKDVIETVGGIYYPKAKSKGIDFDIVLLSRVREELIADPLRLNQIISNLLSNAIKFTPPAGKVMLRIEELKEEKERIWMRFEVTDTGCGISPECQEKIFTAFEQESRDVTTRYGGAGLGLSISHRFAELMGGSLTVKSEVGVGSVFTAELPFGITSQSVSHISCKSIKALVVDECRDTCSYVSSVLQEMGIDVRWADNGFQAVAKAEEAHSKHEDFDICFIDLDMTILDGRETAKRIHNIYDETVIFLTAYASQELEFKGQGVLGIISKPLFASTLIRALSDGHFVKTDNYKTTVKYNFPDKRVLIVEDNDLNMEIAAELVKATGAKVYTVKNGEQAVKAFSGSEIGYFNLILMDIQMPIMDGYEATECIREMDREDAKTVPIFAMTANAFAEDVEKSYDCGMNDHISKPIDLDELYNKMAEQI